MVGILGLELGSFFSFSRIFFCEVVLEVGDGEVLMGLDSDEGAGILTRASTGSE